MKALIIKPC